MILLKIVIFKSMVCGIMNIFNTVLSDIELK